MDLKGWTEIFLKHRDMSRKQIVKMYETEEGFIVKTKEAGEHLCAVMEALTKDILKDDKLRIIVCRNTEENVDRLVSSWEEFSSRNNLLIVFASPITNEKWILNPSLHARIADESSLKQGFMSMASTITMIKG